MRAGIYLGWIGHDNLGDEAIYSLCQRRFRSICWSTPERLDSGPDVARFMRRGSRDLPHLIRVAKDELLRGTRVRNAGAGGLHRLATWCGGQVGLLGGGTLINQEVAYLDSYVALRKRTKSLVPIFGAGVASPEFWSAKSGGLGPPRWPDWKDRRKQWVSILDELPIVGVRGPLSRNLLDEAGARNVVVCGDPAVAYHAGYAKRLSRVRPDRPLRVAINTGDCCGKLWGGTEDVQQSLTKLALWLESQGHHLEFVPVWPRDAAMCVDIARRSGSKISAVSPPLGSPGAFLEKIETFDLVIALKLHAAILSAAANVPFVLLAYQPKALDFAASIGWEDLTIRADELSSSKLIDLVSFLIERLPTRQMELCTAMCKLSNIFEEYCQKIEPLLLGKAPSLKQRSLSERADRLPA